MTMAYPVATKPICTMLYRNNTSHLINSLKENYLSITDIKIKKTGGLAFLLYERLAKED